MDSAGRMTCAPSATDLRARLVWLDSTGAALLQLSGALSARANGPASKRVSTQKRSVCSDRSAKLATSLASYFAGTFPTRHMGAAKEASVNASRIAATCAKLAAGLAIARGHSLSRSSSLQRSHCSRSRVGWAKSGDVLVANAGTYSVAMLPHIFCSLDARNPPVGGNSWSSKGHGKRNARDENGQGAVGGGKVGGKSLGKSRNHKGKGKGGNICRHFLSGHCKFGDRCQFLHE
mmetsp:Transcript_127450/g.318216  ORF Transcript_127450/g.318216 Transcript_127450/m.318216 type:complete len:234 (-) Transcript_127450:21-722(-)